MRKPISVTIDEENLVWLRGQAAATSRGSVSAVLDRLVRDARLAGRTDPAAVRSVVGTIDLPDDDPDLEKADAYVRRAFDRSLRRPFPVRERRPRRRRRG
jgi:hypothetical protein